MPSKSDETKLFIKQCLQMKGPRDRDEEEDGIIFMNIQGMRGNM